jgi:hypothetical protein
MPYRFAGKLMQSGELQIFLSRGDTPVPIKQGEIIEGNYRVESITDERVTLVYVPLGQSTVIPVSSAISAGTPPAHPFSALPLPGGGERGIGGTPSAPAVASSPRIPFPPPQRDNPATAASEMKLPPLLWDGPRQGK